MHMHMHTHTYIDRVNLREKSHSEDIHTWVVMTIYPVAYKEVTPELITATIQLVWQFSHAFCSPVLQPTKVSPKWLDVHKREKG